MFVYGWVGDCHRVVMLELMPLSWPCLPQTFLTLTRCPDNPHISDHLTANTVQGSGPIQWHPLDQPFLIASIQLHWVKSTKSSSRKHNWKRLIKGLTDVHSDPFNVKMKSLQTPTKLKRFSIVCRSAVWVLFQIIVTWPKWPGRLIKGRVRIMLNTEGREGREEDDYYWALGCNVHTLTPSIPEPPLHFQDKLK